MFHVKMIFKDLFELNEDKRVVGNFCTREDAEFARDCFMRRQTVADTEQAIAGTQLIFQASMEDRIAIRDALDAAHATYQRVATGNAVEKLSPKEGDILVLRYRPSMDELNAARHLAEKIHAETSTPVVLLPQNADLSLLHEDVMVEAGWIRKDRIGRIAYDAIVAMGQTKDWSTAIEMVCKKHKWDLPTAHEEIRASLKLATERVRQASCGKIKTDISGVEVRVTDEAVHFGIDATMVSCLALCDKEPHDRIAYMKQWVTCPACKEKLKETEKENGVKVSFTDFAGNRHVCNIEAPPSCTEVVPTGFEITCSDILGKKVVSNEEEKPPEPAKEEPKLPRGGWF